jgi:hypothetical protein
MRALLEARAVPAVVPTFTDVRLTGSVSSYTPAVSPLCQSQFAQRPRVTHRLRITREEE